MAEQWLVFYHGEKELAAYTLRGTFSGERQATIELLACENGTSESEIRTVVELRGGKNGLH